MEVKTIFPNGSIAVVATPLGNAGDLSYRAAAMLAASDVVAAEDTRNAAHLLAELGISKPLYSNHDWNEEARATQFIKMLEEGKRIALISDAGTPGISDPGFDAVRLARRKGFKVIPVPGPSAIITFLSVSGLPTDKFTFLGFLPSKTVRRKKAMEELKEREETLVFYESPHRLEAAIADALEVFGDREAAIGREMTKTYEEFFYGRLSDLLEEIRGIERVRGEICWGISGVARGTQLATHDEVEDLIAAALMEGRHPREVAKEFAKRYNLSSKKLYAQILSQRKNGGD